VEIEARPIADPCYRARAIRHLVLCSIQRWGSARSLGHSELDRRGTPWTHQPGRPRGGRSSAVTGGGTWSTTANGGTSGTYTVTSLVAWESAGPQAATPAFIDNIDEGTRTNGTAVLTIAFSDRTQGVLTIGCHGPGAPPGTFEGIATTKNYKTYYSVEDPSPGVDANRSLFHVR